MLKKYLPDPSHQIEEPPVEQNLLRIFGNGQWLFWTDRSGGYVASRCHWFKCCGVAQKLKSKPGRRKPIWRLDIPNYSTTTYREKSDQPLRKFCWVICYEHWLGGNTTCRHLLIPSVFSLILLYKTVGCGCYDCNTLLLLITLIWLCRWCGRGRAPGNPPLAVIRSFS